MFIDRYPLTKSFYDAEDISVLFFHDGTKILPDLGRQGLLDRSICYLTFSWNVSDKTVETLAQKLDALSALTDDESVRRHVRLLLNSEAEYQRAIKGLPEECCLRFSNAALLNERHYPCLAADKTHDAVYNARANTFKRHELTARVEDKVFVTYDWKRQDIDLEELEPKAIHRNLKGKDVAGVVQAARVGLMLSEVEGACYASLEYLLCGMPVVSTQSEGGRDAYYTERNSILCEATPAAVAAAVDEAVARCKSGDFDAEEIRQGALARMGAFRADLSEAINRDLIALGQTPMPEGTFEDRLRQTNKLWKFRNMRTQSLSELAPDP